MIFSIPPLASLYLFFPLFCQVISVVCTIIHYISPTVPAVKLAICLLLVSCVIATVLIFFMPKLISIFTEELTEFNGDTMRQPGRDETRRPNSMRWVGGENREGGKKEETFHIRTILLVLLLGLPDQDHLRERETSTSWCGWATVSEREEGRERETDRMRCATQWNLNETV